MIVFLADFTQLIRAKNCYRSYSYQSYGVIFLWV